MDHLALSGKLLTLECGMRFLTDHLSGDTSFKIKHPRHSLDRCRNQFVFVRAIEGKLSKMEKIVASHHRVGDPAVLNDWVMMLPITDSAETIPRNLTIFRPAHSHS